MRVCLASEPPVECEIWVLKFTGRGVKGQDLALKVVRSTSLLTVLGTKTATAPAWLQTAGNFTCLSVNICAFYMLYFDEEIQNVTRKRQFSTTSAYNDSNAPMYRATTI